MATTLFKHCSYCSTLVKVSDVISVRQFLVGEDENIPMGETSYNFCSYDHLDKWLWRMGYRFYRDINNERKKSIYNGSKRVARESVGNESIGDNASNGSVLQQRPAQAEPTA